MNVDPTVFGNALIGYINQQIPNLINGAPAAAAALPEAAGAVAAAAAAALPEAAGAVAAAAAAALPEAVVAAAGAAVLPGLVKNPEDAGRLVIVGKFIGQKICEHAYLSLAGATTSVIAVSKIFLPYSWQTSIGETASHSTKVVGGAVIDSGITIAQHTLGPVGEVIVEKGIPFLADAVVAGGSKIANRVLTTAGDKVQQLTTAISEDPIGTLGTMYNLDSAKDKKGLVEWVSEKAQAQFAVWNETYSPAFNNFTAEFGARIEELKPDSHQVLQVAAAVALVTSTLLVVKGLYTLKQSMDRANAAEANAKVEKLLAVIDEKANKVDESEDSSDYKDAVEDSQSEGELPLNQTQWIPNPRAQQ